MRGAEPYPNPLGYCPRIPGGREKSRISARSWAAGGLVVAALFTAGCGGTVVDDVKMADTLAAELEASGAKVSSVDCPSEVPVETGTKFECTVKLADGTEKIATLKVTDKDADIAFLDLSPSK
jgi:NAD(P)H-hydrate repair Nnr-like enzyme with NAD(P)H-hydrate epimerase domain